MSKLDRFQPPRTEDEFYDCACCGVEFYYTVLDDLGVCPGCRKEREEDEE